jgi:hypothetical protein
VVENVSNPFTSSIQCFAKTYVKLPCFAIRVDYHTVNYRINKKNNMLIFLCPKIGY